MSVVNAAFDQPLELEEHASMPLAGGIEQMGFQCGQLWGAALAAGAQAYQLFGPGPQAEAAALIAAQRLAASFRTRYKSINCLDVVDLDWKNPNATQILKFFVKGGPIRCFTSTAGFVRTAINEINTTFADHQLEALPPQRPTPISCAALLARKMGASDLHTVTAAGLAGGIGLSGGACGALGAAIWIIEMNRVQAGSGKVEYNSSEATEAIDRFVQSSNGEFECAKITGQRFENVADHAGYLRADGCSKIIEALAAQPV